jgi:hypothetical protein
VFRREVDNFQVKSGAAQEFGSGIQTTARRFDIEYRASARPNGDQTVKYTVMCKMVAWLARESQTAGTARTGILPVQTEEGMLLAALRSKDERIWRYHGEHLRRWAAEHRKLLRALADDQKAEQKSGPRFADRKTSAVLRYRNRMGSAVREIAAQLVAYAAKLDYAAIEYDDSIRDFCPEFPYRALREQIRTKCQALGLGFRLRVENVELETQLPKSEPSLSGHILPGHR